MSHQNWTYDEFLTFLLIYVAHVDMEFAEEEKAFIRRTSGSDMFEKMLALFNEVSDFQAYQTILDYKQTHYPDEQKKADLLDKIQSLFDADAEFNIMEKELLHFLERMM